MRPFYTKKAFLLSCIFRISVSKNSGNLSNGQIGAERCFTEQSRVSEHLLRSLTADRSYLNMIA
jgi:hypothetical protein